MIVRPNKKAVLRATQWVFELSKRSCRLRGRPDPIGNVFGFPRGSAFSLPVTKRWEGGGSILIGSSIFSGPIHLSPWFPSLPEEVAYGPNGSISGQAPQERRRSTAGPMEHPR